LGFIPRTARSFALEQFFKFVSTETKMDRAFFGDETALWPYRG
jgi:hypothetical protein